jgi:hypothetical protein
VLQLVVIGAFLLADLGAAADARAPSGLGKTFFVPVGLNLGGAMAPYGRFHVGGEVSAVWTSAPFSHERPFVAFWGLYSDVLYVPGNGCRFTVGPELGWTILAIDGGYEGIADAGGYRHAVAVRALTHVPNLFLSLYARGHYVSSGFPFFDFGVLFKLPLGYQPYYSGDAR